MQRKKRIDIDNFEKSFNTLHTEVEAFQSLFNMLNIEYLNKISGTLDVSRNSNYYIIRDSIFFRYDSILFHTRLLQSVQQNQYQILNREKNKLEAVHNYEFSFFDQQYQIFDSIIFHSISFFDYLANLIGFIVTGNMNMKWNGIMKSIRDSGNQFSKFEISKILRDENYNIVDKLYVYRSELIHNSKDVGGFRTDYDIFKDEMNLTVMAPKKFCFKFFELRKLRKENDVTINYVVFWIVERILKSTIRIITSLMEHIDKHRKTPVGSEIFLLGNPREREDSNF